MFLLTPPRKLFSAGMARELVTKERERRAIRKAFANMLTSEDMKDRLLGGVGSVLSKMLGRKESKMATPGRCNAAMH